MATGAKIARNIRPLSEYRNEAHRCIRCGMCRMTNPDFVASHKYSDNCPRGTRYMFESFFGSGIYEIARALTADPPELEVDERLREIIWTCTVCGNCQDTCNSIKGLEPTNTMMALREFLIRQGVSPFKEHETLIKSIINYDNPWLSPRANRGKWARRLKDIEIKDASKEKVEVLYFPGCNASYVAEMIPVAVASAKILDLAGVDFGILGNNERCCGSTAFRIGAVDWFEDYKKKNIEQLNSLGIKTMVTACAGCHSTFSHSYAGELDFEVVHIVEYLERMINEGKLNFKKELGMKVTYHDPCHIGRYSGIYDPPRNVLQALPGVEFKEMERIRNYSWCCGSGGGVKTAYGDFALWSAHQRLEEARDVAGANIVVSCCPFCEINLGDAAKAVGMEVLDLMELVDRALGG